MKTTCINKNNLESNLINVREKKYNYTKSGVHRSNKNNCEAMNI